MVAYCLGLSRKHVWHILAVFPEEGFAGLEDQRSRPAAHPENQLTLPFLAEILEVQKDYLRAGKFRVRGIVAQRTGKMPSETTIGQAMAINWRHHQAPPDWRTDRIKDDQFAEIVKHRPFPPNYRHLYWFIGFRFLVRIGEDRHWVYSLLRGSGHAARVADAVCVAAARVPGTGRRTVAQDWAPAL